MPKQTRRRFDPEWKKMLGAEAKRNGITATAKKHGVSAKNVGEWARGKGLAAGGGGRYFSPETKAAAVAKVRAGARAVEVAKSLGVSRSVLDNWRRRAGAAVAPVGRPLADPALKDKILAEYAAAGGTYGTAARLGRAHGLSRQVVQGWISRAGMRKGRRGRSADLVATTNAALREANDGHRPALGPHLKELFLKLRANGVERIVNLEVADGTCTVTYQIKETFEL